MAASSRESPNGRLDWSAPLRLTQGRPKFRERTTFPAPRSSLHTGQREPTRDGEVAVRTPSRRRGGPGMDVLTGCVLS